jgi:hypothetical protein
MLRLTTGKHLKKDNQPEKSNNVKQIVGGYLKVLLEVTERCINECAWGGDGSSNCNSPEELSDGDPDNHSQLPRIRDRWNPAPEVGKKDEGWVFEGRETIKTNKMMFDALIKLGREFNSATESEIKALFNELKTVRPVNLFFNRIVCQLSYDFTTVNKGANSSMISTSEFEWRQLFFNRNRITVQEMASVDPFSRNKIRISNLSMLKNKVESSYYNSIRSRVIEMGDVDQILVLLEYGLFEAGNCKLILEKVQKYCRKLFGGTGEDDDDEVYNEREDGLSHDKILPLFSTNLIDLLGKNNNNSNNNSNNNNESQEEKQMRRRHYEQVLNTCTRTTRQQLQTALDIILHCIILTTDQALPMPIPSQSFLFKKEKSEDNANASNTSSTMARIKYIMMDMLMHRLDSMIEYMDDWLVSTRIDQIIKCMLSVDGDIMAKSINVIMDNRWVMEYHAKIGYDLLYDKQVFSEHVESVIKDLNDILMNIVNGDYEENRFAKSQTLRDKIDAVLNRIAQKNNPEMEEVHKLDDAVMTPTGQNLSFSYSFTLSNGIFLLLNVALAMSSNEAAWKELAVRELVGKALDTVSSVVKNNVLAVGHLLRNDEMNILQRLYNILPAHVLSILYTLSTSCPEPFLDHPEAYNYLHSLTLAALDQYSVYISKYQLPPLDIMYRLYMILSMHIDVYKGLGGGSVHRMGMGYTLQPVLIEIIDHVLHTGYGDRKEYTPVLNNKEFSDVARMYMLHANSKNGDDHQSMRMNMQWEVSMSIIALFNETYLYTRCTIDDKRQMFGGKQGNNKANLQNSLSQKDLKNRMKPQEDFSKDKLPTMVLPVMITGADSMGSSKVELRDAPGGYSAQVHNQAPMQITKLLESFDQFDKGLYFSKHILNLYTRTRVLEPQETMKRYSRYPVVNSPEFINEFIAPRTLEIIGVVNHLRKLRPSRFSMENEPTNREYMYQAFLPLLYKFLTILDQEITVEDHMMDYTLVQKLLDTLVENKASIIRILGRTSEAKRYHKGIFSSILVSIEEGKGEDDYHEKLGRNGENWFKGNDKTLKQFLESIEYLYEDYPEYEHHISIYKKSLAKEQFACERNALKLLKGIESTGSIALLNFKKKLTDFLPMASLEHIVKNTPPKSPSQRPSSKIPSRSSSSNNRRPMSVTSSNLTDKNIDMDIADNKSVIMMSGKKENNLGGGDGKGHGQSTSSLKVGVNLQGVDEKTPKKSSNLGDSFEFGDGTRNKQKGNIVAPAGMSKTMFSSSNNKIEPAVKSITQISKEDNKLADLRLRISSYYDQKASSLTNPNSILYEMLDEGTDTDSDEYYRIILDWAILFIQHRYCNPLIVRRLERVIEPCDEISIMDNDIVSWMTCLEFIVKAKSSRVKTILYSRYFEDEEAITNDAFDESPHAHPQTATKPTQQEAPTSNQDEYDHYTDPEKLDLKPIGESFIKKILQSILLFQNNIRGEFFDRSLPIYFKYYFLFSGFIKTLAEDNSEHFKKYIGDFIMSTDCENPTTLARQDIEDQYFLDCYYRGLIFNDTQDTDPVISAQTASDRSDLYLYNIITLNTLSECFNGPCKQNQDMFIKRISPLICVLLKIDDNIFSIRYLLQESVVRLLSSLFEGDNESKINDANKNTRPVIYYDIIVQYIARLWACREQLQGKNRLDTLLKKPPSIDSNHALIHEFNKLPGVCIVTTPDPPSTSKFHYPINPTSTSAPITRSTSPLMSPTASTSPLSTLKSLHQSNHIEKALNAQRAHLNHVYSPPESAKDILDDYYKKCSVFSDHPSINISNTILYIMQTIATKNRKFKRFCDEKVKEMFQIYDRDTIQIDQATIKLIYSYKDMQEPIPPERINKLVYYHFINCISSSIEVINAAEKSIIVPFQILPECLTLTENSKDQFRMKCDISETSRKLLDLMNHSQEFIIEMQSNLEMYKKSYFISMITTNDAFINMGKLVWYLSLLMNLIALTNWRTDPNAQTGQRVIASSSSKTATLAIRIVIMIISSLGLILWFTFTYKIIRTKNLEKYANSKLTNNARAFMKSKGTKQSEQSDKVEESPITNKVLTEKKPKGLNKLRILIYDSIMTQYFPASFALHLIFASLTFWHHFYQTLHLLMIVYINETSRYVFKSIQMHFRQLLFTLIMVVFVIYTYTVIIAYFFSKTFKDDDTGGYSVCDHLNGCFGFAIDSGFINGGGIGDSMVVLSYKSHQFYYKTILEFTFFIIVNFVLVNIFFGIIVDTFKELRNDLQKREEDEMNICFVCGFSRKDFERQEKSFDFHIKYEHNIWNYIYFIAYLIRKSPNEYTGIDYLIREKYIMKSTDWLPIQKTQYLSRVFPNPRREC